MRSTELRSDRVEPSPAAATPVAPLDGMKVLVTGASSGIGRSIALAAARAGADVALTYKDNEDGARATVRNVEVLGRNATAIRLDLADEAAVARAADVARDALGRVDAWVNNAGADVLTGDGARLSDIDKLDLLLRVDLRGTMIASWRAVEVMAEQEEGGVIVNMSWDHALAGMPGRNPEIFSAVKGGVLSFSKSLARTVAPRVRVNVVAPGWIETAFGAGLDDERRRAVAEATPLGRWGTPDDVAAAALFLMSPVASFLTGQTIMVGGGIVM
ncbi:MAG: SDR family NAD(P)-dependent oxidoreductase [Gemmatimonadaceae bacterium]